MPQDRRKVAFSTKQKKEQLKQKRAKKNAAHFSQEDGSRYEVVSSKSDAGYTEQKSDVEVLNKQPVNSSKHDANRYKLMFKRESADVMKQKISEAQKAFEFLPEEELEVSYEEVFAPGSELDMPKRPVWDSSMTKEVLEAREEKYFREYIANLENRFKDDVGHFDMNLETWRQLWRVLEFSDIVLLVTDIRYPIFHFSPALYDYVVNEMNKDMIVVFNKIDLVDPHVIIAWKEYFQSHFPKLKLMYFASYAGMKVKEGSKGRRVGKLHMAIDGSRDLLKLCEEIANGQVDLSSWRKKIDEEAAEVGFNADNEEDYCEIEDDDDEDEKKQRKSKNNANQSNCSDTSYYREARYKDGILTIGFVGHPNVGKSSFLNAVMGKKVVSVSRTPGHTKHYQTILLTPTVRLCDCPGLVFPSLIPKAMQVLMGCYPIAQLREPYSAISYLCQRVPVHKILRLLHPEFDRKHPNEDLQWSAFDICVAWAQKRGFVTSKSARADVYRAANQILRMALDGRTICLCFYPPGFVKNKDSWMKHPDIDKVRIIQARRREDQKYFQERPSKVKGACGDMAHQHQSDEDEENSADGSQEDSDENDDYGCTSSATNKYSLLAELT